MVGKERRCLWGLFVSFLLLDGLGSEGEACCLREVRSRPSGQGVLLGRSRMSGDVEWGWRRPRRRRRGTGRGGVGAMTSLGRPLLIYPSIGFL